MNEKRYKSIVALWGIIFLCLQAISIVYTFGIRPDAYNQVHKIVAAIVAAIIIVLIIIFMSLSLKMKKSGPIIGMIIGGIYIIPFTIVNLVAGVYAVIINIIVGMCFILSCASLLKELNVGTTKTEE